MFNYFFKSQRICFKWFFKGCLQWYNNIMTEHKAPMQAAIRMAQKAAKKDEVPIGAVIIKNGRIVSKGYNTRETRKDPLGHAEIMAIRKAARKMGGWRLSGCTLYVTLEPCPMCAGAIINARIDTVVFGAYDPKAGAFGSLYDLSEGKLNHNPISLAVCLKTNAQRCSKIFSLVKENSAYILTRDIVMHIIDL